MRDQPNREKIIEAASRLFHRRGFQSTSLDEILEASGVCRSNFYYHFRSKEDLGLEALSRQAEGFETRVLQRILDDRSVPARQRLARLYEAIADRQQAEEFRYGCPFGNLAAELCGIHGEFRRRLSQFFERWEASLERCLQEGVTRGEFRCNLETRSVAQALLSQIEGAILLTKTHGHRGPIETGVQAMLMLLESR